MLVDKCKCGLSVVPEKMCDPVEIKNAILESENRKYRIGQRITYTCMEGYSGNPYRICTETGVSGDTFCKGE